MSDILKKITGIEPDEADILDAIKVKPKSLEKKPPLFSSIEEVNIDDDPVPSFITRDKIEDPQPQTDDSIIKPIEPIDSPEAIKESIKEPIEEPVIVSEPISDEIEIVSEKNEVPIEDIAATPQEFPAANFDNAPTYTWTNWIGILCATIWIAASFSYFYGFFELRQKWTDLSPMQIFGLVMAILLPAILLIILFYTLKQLSKLSAQSHKLTRAAYQLTQPDDNLVAKTSLMASAIKTEVDSVDSRIDQALARMSTLEEVLKERDQSLETATGNTSQTTDEIASRLSTQRLALESIAGTFDNRMAMLSSSLTEHTTKLDGSTHIAEQKIQEARVSVEGAAERINAASEVVRGNSLDAATALTKSHEEIEGLADMIRARSAELDEVYRKHAQDLTGMIAQLRDEQQNLSISLDERLAKMRDMSLAAKVSAESLTDASEAGRHTVEALATATRLTDTAVKQRFSEMEDMVKFSSEKAETISDQAARRVQDSLVQTRREISRIEDDMLAMQSRLSTASEPQDKLSLNEPKQTKKRSRGRIKLRPVKEDSPKIAKPDTPDNADDLEIPSLRSSPLKEPLSFSNEKLNLEIDTENSIEASPEPTAMQALTDDVIPKQDIIEPLQPATPQKKSRGGWKWRDMLGGLDKPDTPPMTSQIDKPIQRNISNERMIASLSALGLSPAAIIDDGCIIEATNMRRSKGSNAMSQTVSKRIGGPIRHLHRSMEENAALKSDARAYVAQFNARINAIESDREAIRTRLESDAGRAFLLCDAALNG